MPSPQRLSYYFICYYLYPSICSSTFNAERPVSRSCHLLSLLPQVLYMDDACYTPERSKTSCFKSDVVAPYFCSLTTSYASTRSDWTPEWNDSSTEVWRCIRSSLSSHISRSPVISTVTHKSLACHHLQLNFTSSTSQNVLLKTHTLQEFSLPKVIPRTWPHCINMRKQGCSFQAFIGINQ